MVQRQAQVFYKAVENNDMDLAETMLSPDILYYSPAMHEPLRGSAITAMTVRAAFEEWESFRYVRELVDGEGSALIWEATFDGVPISGCDVFRWDEQGRLAELFVTARPVKAAEMLVNRVLAKLAGDPAAVTP